MDDDCQKGYLATDGSWISIPDVVEPPDAEIDLANWRDSLRDNLVARRGLHFRWLREYCENTLRFARQHHGKVEDTEIEGVKDTLIEVDTAEKRHEKEIPDHVERMLRSFASVDDTETFSFHISLFCGHNFIGYADSDIGEVETYTPWLRPLLAALAPARQAGVFRSINQPTLFRLGQGKSFHEKDLMSFLKSPYGDMRLIECATGVPDSLKEYDAIELGWASAQVPNEKPESDPDWMHPYYGGIYQDQNLDLKKCADLVPRLLGISLDPGLLEGAPYLRLQIKQRFWGIMCAVYAPLQGDIVRHFCREPKYSKMAKAPAESLWPYIASHQNVLDAAFFDLLNPKSGLPVYGYGAMQALSFLPAMPRRYADVVSQIASDGKKWEKALAAKLLD